MNTQERFTFVEKCFKLIEIARTVSPLDVIQLASHYETIACQTSGMEPIALRMRDLIDQSADRLFA